MGGTAVAGILLRWRGALSRKRYKCAYASIAHRSHVRGRRILYYAALVLAIGAGIFFGCLRHCLQTVRLACAAGFAHPTAKFSGIGFDEGLYREYVNALSKVGIGWLPETL